MEKGYASSKPPPGHSANFIVVYQNMNMEANWIAEIMQREQ